MGRRVAAIDVGTNAIRFYSVEVDGDSVARVLAEERFAVRLGHGVFADRRIDRAASAEAMDALAHASARMRELGIEEYRAVATSAIRESSSRREFVRSVKRRSGITLEVISGSEEIRLVHAAVRERIDLGQDTWALVELGGGSAEIALVTSSRVLWSETHAMGAVRLFELFAPGARESPQFLELLSEYVDTIRIPQKIRETTIRGFIATGGNIEVLARIAANGRRDSVENRDPGPSRLALTALRSVTRQLARLSVEDRMRDFELRGDRADVVVPAAAVYSRFADLLGASEILVPGGGIRDGIILGLAEKSVTRRTKDEEGLIEGAVALGRKYSFDEGHALHVARLARQLFDQLVPLHKLGSRERRMLVAAAILHDIGEYVSLKGHHKHTLYLISRSELTGFTSAEQFIVANVARYHRKGAPSLQHPEFALLSAADRSRVRRLASLLRIADALDKEHREKLSKITVRQTEGRVEILAGGNGELLLEKWALEKKADLFRRTFGAPVLLISEEPDTDD